MHHLEPLHKAGLGSHRLLQIFKLEHLLGRDQELLLLLVRTGILDCDRLFGLVLLASLFVLDLLFVADVAEEEMILEPLILSFVIDEVSEELPVARSVL